MNPLANLPDSTRVSLIVGSGDMTMGELRELLSREEDERVLTTGEASEVFGYSQSQWTTWAADGEIDEAYRDDGDSGYWRLPALGCREHLARLRDPMNAKRRSRAPWKRTPASAEQAGPEGLPAWSVVCGGSAPVGRRKADTQEPGSSGLADAG